MRKLLFWLHICTDQAVGARSFLTRAGRQEQVFDRETVLGRDSSSVFPTESKQAAAEAAEALKAKLGANRFITETEVRVCPGTGFTEAYWPAL